MARVAMAENKCWRAVVVAALFFALAGASSVSGMEDATAVPMVTLEPKLSGQSSGSGHAGLHSRPSRSNSSSSSPSRRLTTVSVWCVAKGNQSEANLQGALDWVCGPLPSQGQVNCVAVQNGQNCFLPDSLQSHASWAFNVYFQAHNATSDACDFQGTATQVDKDPSTSTCVFAGATKEINGTISNATMTPPPPGYYIPLGPAAPLLEPQLVSAAAAVVLLLIQLPCLRT